MLKAAVFDLGGVYFTNGTERLIGIISKKHAIPEEKVRRAFDLGLGRDYPVSESEVYDVWRIFSGRLGLKDAPEKLDRLDLEGYTPIEGTVGIIRRLRSHGIRVFYLSDITPERVDYFNSKYRFLDDFDGGVFSFELGTSKPDPKMYRAVLRKAGVKPIDAVFIDDKKKLLRPAMEMGFKAIHFKNSKQLSASLRKLGLI
ncbi:MAG: HAD family phosphatase [Candidatus Altiarchaeota archaeon]|nr:HAD family phosphatase [Candidatus Altiarchaeota archaeon]